MQRINGSTLTGALCHTQSSERCDRSSQWCHGASGFNSANGSNGLGEWFRSQRSPLFGSSQPEGGLYVATRGIKSVLSLLRSLGSRQHPASGLGSIQPAVWAAWHGMAWHGVRCTCAVDRRGQVLLDEVEVVERNQCSGLQKGGKGKMAKKKGSLKRRKGKINKMGVKLLHYRI